MLRYTGYCRFPAVAIGLLHGRDLPFLARGPKALAAPVRGHAKSAHHGLDRVAVGQRLFQGLHQHRHIAFGAYQSIGAGVEGARAGGAHGLCGGKQHQCVALDVRSPSGDCHVHAPQLQGAAGKEHCLQRRCTRRIQGHERPGQPERLGDRAGDHARAHVRRVCTSRREPRTDGFDEFSNYFLLLWRWKVAELVDFQKELRRFFHARGISIVA